LQTLLDYAGDLVTTVVVPAGKGPEVQAALDAADPPLGRFRVVEDSACPADKVLLFPPRRPDWSP
jgi:hypothetical protein